jgi:hypothetical protein
MGSIQPRFFEKISYLLDDLADKVTKQAKQYDLIFPSVLRSTAPYSTISSFFLVFTTPILLEV